MTHDPSAVGEMARRLLRREAGGSREPDVLAAATEQVCRKLAGELEPLVGRGGVSALVRRALNVAKREDALLAEVQMAAGSPLALPGMDEALRECSPEQAEAAGAAIVTQLLALLVSLLGEDLGLRPVWKVWPRLVDGHAVPNAEEGVENE